MSQPLFIKEAKNLATHLRSLSKEELQKVMKTSSSLTESTYQLYQDLSFEREGSPALLTYQGIQYQYMGASVFTDSELAYLQEHLFILSGLYGLLRPMDSIQLYRLEMQAKCPFSLYEFWQDRLAKVLPEGPLLNLASQEYAKVIRPYLPLIDVSFYQYDNGKWKEKGVYAKMARGEMVRFLAENQIDTIQDVQQFHRLNYQFDPELSTSTHLVFKQQKTE